MVKGRRREGYRERERKEEKEKSKKSEKKELTREKRSGIITEHAARCCELDL